MFRLGCFILGTVIAGASCSGGHPPARNPVTSTTALAGAAADAPVPFRLDTQLDPSVREALLKPFTGDLDEMVARRLVRIGVPFNRTFYFVDRGVPRGVAYEYGQLVEARLNARFNSGHTHDAKVHVYYVPLRRDQLLPALTEGTVDLVAAQVTVRPSLEKLVDFTNPTRVNVNQVVVTGPGGPAMTSVDDLAGQRLFVRKSSPYHESLVALNETLRAQGKPEAILQDAPENLEDDDLMEMANAGLIPATVVDDYVATFWQKVFPEITVHHDVAVRTGGTLAIAIRKHSPKLKEGLNRFMGTYGLGTAFGNQVERKYLVSTKYVTTAASEADRRKFLAVVQLFRQYSDQYDVDYLLMAAQGYQESRLNQAARSKAGAIGIMQILPATGRALHVGNIRKVDPNIHGGVKYMRQVLDANFADEPMDALNKGLFTFASYNAGPRRIRELRGDADRRGLDPNVWFGNVEQIASEEIGRETVTYVSNIYKYYVAYRLVIEEEARRDAAKADLRAAADKP